MIKNVRKALTKVLKDFKLIHTYIHTYMAYAKNNVLYKEVAWQLCYNTSSRKEGKYLIYLSSFFGGVLCQH